MLRDKIRRFLLKVEGRSYTSKSLSKVLNMNHETARKYMREGYFMGSLSRFWTNRKGQKAGYRYYI
ncbi:hypothetical protein KAR91_08645 [Candidatus Pacearchaeota archaeon]|nr:hypothetical protein [Candidatus Pacearchaeota archaeon]